MNTKQKVNRLFAILRNTHGFVARQNYMCCGSCAGAAIASEPRGHGRPYAFYCQQSNEAWEREGRGRGPYTGDLEQTLYVNFGFYSGNDDESPTLFLNAGRTIVSEAEALGLRVSWDGAASSAIGILPE